MSNFVMTSLSDTEREDLMVKLWEQHDVVDVMKLTGHGEGLEEERLVQVFGEESARM
jgi:leucyl aminopeptidase